MIVSLVNEFVCCGVHLYKSKYYWSIQETQCGPLLAVQKCQKRKEPLYVK